MDKLKNKYDVIIVGSGFGGSVSALRLSEIGYKVLVLEMGKRYETKDFPKTNWNLRKFLWMPNLFLYGIQCITLLKNIFILHGAGVGGGFNQAGFEGNLPGRNPGYYEPYTY